MARLSFNFKGKRPRLLPGPQKLTPRESGGGGKVFLGVSPYHPKRKEFYNNQCKALGLKEIYFSKINMGLGKKINDQNISNELGYEFKRPKF